MATLDGRSISVTALAARIMDRYDRNEDGYISLRGNDDSESPTRQSEKVVTNNAVDLSSTFTYCGETYPKPMLITRQRSMGPLFIAADANHDNKATLCEIQVLLKGYVGDSDRLDADAWSRLESDFPETSTRQQRELEHNWPDGRYETELEYTEKVPTSDTRVNLAQAADIYHIAP